MALKHGHFTGLGMAMAELAVMGVPSRPRISSSGARDPFVSR
ncbi:MAG TPA: hypothetical protein VFW04_16930 [Gemmatimonadaceae bacterium]|nr:hypothetical protein [Gemmatimonadaceae bacterium]